MPNIWPQQSSSLAAAAAFIAISKLRSIFHLSMSTVPCMQSWLALKSSCFLMFQKALLANTKENGVLLLPQSTALEPSTFHYQNTKTPKYLHLLLIPPLLLSHHIAYSKLIKLPSLTLSSRKISTSFRS